MVASNSSANGVKRRRAVSSPLTPAPDGSRLPSRAPTWEILRRYLEEQIASGVYPVGSWLPSVRELAAKLNVNRNTVSKVYQALGRAGILNMSPGRGVYVATRPALSSTDSVESRISEAVTEVVREASVLGIDRAWLLDRVQGTLDNVYGGQLLKVAFIECTQPDTRQVASQLSGHLSVPVSPIDLADFAKGPGALASQFDLLTTTYFHLQEVTSAAPSGGPPIVGINHTVSHESILQIARLRPGSTIVVVSPNQRSLDRMSRIVEDYARGQIIRVIPGPDGNLPKALAVADAVVDMSSTHDLVRRQAPETPTITVTFNIEPQSLEYLGGVVRSISIASKGNRSNA